MTELPPPPSRRLPRILAVLVPLAAVLLVIALRLTSSRPPDSGRGSERRLSALLHYPPRNPNFDTSGYTTITSAMAQWRPWRVTATLEEVAASFAATPGLIKRRAQERLAVSYLASEERLYWTLVHAQLLNFQGKPAQAYQ